MSSQDLVQLEPYDQRPAITSEHDHHEFNFLFDHHHQPDGTIVDSAVDQVETETAKLLARLDFGIKISQEDIRLKDLDRSVEHALNYNQTYLDEIKKTLDQLNQYHQRAQKFLAISKHCIKEVQKQQQQQKQKTVTDLSVSRSASSSSVRIDSRRESVINTCPATAQDHKNLNLVSDQICSVSLPWLKFKFGADLPSFEDGRRRDQYNALLHQQPWQPPERRKLDEEVAKQLEKNDQDKKKIDWEVVGKSFPDRKPIECKIQWTQKQDSSINKSKWTSHEVDRLFEIVKKSNYQRWDLISQELGTGRTPSECVKQFRIVTQEKREWTEADDLLLKEGVSTYGQNWQAVANHCGRSSNQCINRWSKTLRPDIKKGKWDPIEDEALKNAVAACGMVWKDVAPRVRGRTDAQCRERWCNILDPKIVVGNWSREEDETILRMRDLEGKTWSEISKRFDGRRTDNHCMRRHSELKRVKDSTSKKPSQVKNSTPTNSIQPFKRSQSQARPVPQRGRQSTQDRVNHGGSSSSTPQSVTNVPTPPTVGTAGSMTPKPKPQNTLGRALIQSDSGFTRRNHPTSSIVANHAPSIHPASTTPQQPRPSLDRPPTSSTVQLSLTNPDLSLHSSSPSPVPAAQSNGLFQRNPNCRLRVTNKRIKYSS